MLKCKLYTVLTFAMVSNLTVIVNKYPFISFFILINAVIVALKLWRESAVTYTVVKVFTVIVIQ